MNIKLSIWSYSLFRDSNCEESPTLSLQCKTPVEKISKDRVGVLLIATARHAFLILRSKLGSIIITWCYAPKKLLDTEERVSMSKRTQFRRGVLKGTSDSVGWSECQDGLWRYLVGAYNGEVCQHKANQKVSRVSTDNKHRIRSIMSGAKINLGVIFWMYVNK